MFSFLKRVRGDSSGAIASQVVRARRVKSGGQRLISVQSGTELFTFDPAGQTRIYVGQLEGDKSHHLLGVDRNGITASLAHFASPLAAQRAHASVAQVFAGFSAGSMFKWAVGLLLGYLLLNAAFSGPQQSVTQVSSTDSAMQLVQRNLAPTSNVQASDKTAAAVGFDAHEPSLDQLAELAAGGYKFQPKLQAPQVEAPTLNCAQK